jgi:hypothetical protein
MNDNYCSRCGVPTGPSSVHVSGSRYYEYVPALEDPRAEERAIINDKLDRLIDLLERLCHFEGYRP